MEYKNLIEGLDKLASQIKECQEKDRKIAELEEKLSQYELMEDRLLDLSDAVSRTIVSNYRTLLRVRSSGEYKDKSFFLNDNFNWKIIKDSLGSYCLIPTRK